MHFSAVSVWGPTAAVSATTSTRGGSLLLSLKPGQSTPGSSVLIPVQGLGGDSSFVIQEFKIKNVNVLKNNNNNNKNSLQIQHLILYVADSSDNDNTWRVNNILTNQQVTEEIK